MFDKLKRKMARSRHQSDVNDHLKKLAAALPAVSLEHEVDITSNSHLEAFVEGMQDRNLAAKVQPLVKEMQNLNLERKKLYAELLDRFHTKDAPSQNSRKGMEQYLAETEAQMKDVEEYFGQAGSGGFEQIDIMEDRIELIKDILHLLPEHYEYTGPKFKASASSVPPTPAVAAAEEKGKLASLPELPASAAAQVQAQAPPTPVVAEYVN